MAKRRRSKKQSDYRFNEHDHNQVEGIRKKRKAVRLKKQVKIFLFLVAIGLFFVYLKHDISHVKKINIQGNIVLSEEDIIETLGIDTSSRHLFLIPMFLEKKLEKEPLIHNATITKGLFNQINISIEEITLIGYIYEENVIRVIGSNGSIASLRSIDKLTDIQNNPRVKGFSDDEMLKKFTKEYCKVPESVRTQISDITYDPLDILETRIRLDMRDGVIVYIKIEELEKSLKSYNDVKASYNDKCTVIDFVKKNVYATGDGCDYIVQEE